MKNQNDLIFSIVAGVIGIACVLGFFFTKREPIAPAAPTTVNVSKVPLPNPEPTMVNGLSGGSNAAGGFGGFGGPSMGGGRPGLSAPGGPSGAMGGGMGGGKPRGGMSADS